jgi:hypothetical protein
MLKGILLWFGPIVFKEWGDPPIELLIWLIINLVTKQNLCIVSKEQSIKLFAPCETLKVQREQYLSIP